MKKRGVSVKPLVYFISFVLGLFLVCIIGIKNTYALTISDYEVTWYYRNQSNESNLLNEIKPYNEPSMTVDGEYINGYSTRIEYTFTKDMQYIISYNLFLQYSLSDDSNLRSDFLTRIENNCYADSDFKVLDCTAKQVSKNCGEGCDLTINVTQQVKVINNTSAIRFGVYPNSNFSLGFYNHDSTINYLMQNINVNDNSSGAIIDQNNQIIDQNNKTNEELENINGSINQSTEDLKESITESNKETQEVIKDQFNSCSQFDKNITNFTYGSISGSNGQNTSDSSTTRLRTDFFEVDSLKQYTVSFLDDMVYQFYIFEYNSNKSFIKRVPPSSWGTNGFTFTTSSNTKYLRFVIRNSNDVVFDNLDIGTLNIKGEEICTNKIDETNDKLDNLQGAITDESIPDVSKLGDTVGVLPPGPVDSILTLPLTMLNNLMTNLNGTCNEVEVELPYVKKNITLPCIKSLYDKMGVTGTIFTSVGLIASAFILFNYLLNLYKWVDDTLTLRENTMPGYFEDKWGGGA